MTLHCHQVLVVGRRKFRKKPMEIGFQQSLDVWSSAQDAEVACKVEFHMQYPKHKILLTQVIHVTPEQLQVALGEAGDA